MKELKEKRILIISILLVLIVSVIGATLAYFSLTVTGNTTASSITISNAKLHLTYDGGIKITGSAIYPNNDTPIGTKELVITNDGTVDVYYKLYWQELYNELVPKDASSEDELYITATCTSYSNYGTGTQTVSGTCNNFTKDIQTKNPKYEYSSGEIDSEYIISENNSISVGITHVYELKVYFRNENYEQNYNQNKEFYGSIAVSESEASASASLPSAKSDLASYTWAEIKQLSDALVAGTIDEEDLSDIYNISIGDTTASVSITPTIGYEYVDDYPPIRVTNTPSEESHTFRLVGLKHDKDASGKILGMTFEQTDLMKVTYAMKSSPTASDSWANSDIFTEINKFTIQSDLNSVITPANKPYVTSATNSTLSYVASKLWIMSETEIAGTQTETYGNVVEGKQYQYYVTNNEASDRMKYSVIEIDVDGTPYPFEISTYYLRSANEYDSGYDSNFPNGFSVFTGVAYSEGWDVVLIDCDLAEGIALCFCI